jgi:uncharacterized delta-60 repeat protein
MFLGHRLFALLLLASLFAPAGAQPGGLDTTFGNDGLALGETPSLARDLVQDLDARIVFVGARALAGAPDEPMVGRLLPDGTPDPSFDTNGLEAFPLPCRYPSRTTLEAVALAPDRDIVAAGITGCRRGTVVRLTERGSPAGDFASDGVFTFQPDGSRSSALLGLDVAQDGTIVAVGREERRETSGETRTYLLVLRLTPAGQLDAAFGSGGIVRLPVSDDLLPDSQLNDVVIYPDGRVLAAGYVTILGSVSTIVVRLNPDGTPDASFEGGGLVVHDLGDGVADLANSVLYGPDGAIYLGGTRLAGGSFAFFGARLLFDGTRDPSFGSAGVSTVQAIAGASCVARDAALDFTGRLALAGDCAQSATQAWAVARLLPDGSPDGTFGDAGVLLPDAPGTTRTLHGIIRLGDGRLVIAGMAEQAGVPVWAVARILEYPVTAVEVASRGAFPVSVSPNPASGAARVRFDLDADAEVSLTLYDVLGRVATQHAAGRLPAGARVLVLDVSSLARGAYIVRLQTGARVATQALTVR